MMSSGSTWINRPGKGTPDFSISKEMMETNGTLEEAVNITLEAVAMVILHSNHGIGVVAPFLLASDGGTGDPCTSGVIEQQPAAAEDLKRKAEAARNVLLAEWRDHLVVRSTY